MTICPATPQDTGLVLGWNESAIGFYQRLGAKRIDDRSRYRLEGHALDALAGL